MDSNVMTIDNVPNVDIAKKQWMAYQELCKGILDKSDYQKIRVKDRDEIGRPVFVEREFKKKSAWQKLARAFNVDTHIVEKEFQRSTTGKVREAYYCVRATLPNGRSVESDALCNRSEKGKKNVSDHTIMATAKTRATNRAISELIGAGEVSSDEMTAEFKAVDDSDSADEKGEPLIGEPIIKTEAVKDEPVLEEETMTKPVENEPPKLIKDCIDALSQRRGRITNEAVRVCIKDRCKDQAEHNLCMKWLDENIIFGGS